MCKRSVNRSLRGRGEGGLLALRYVLCVMCVCVCVCSESVQEVRIVCLQC